jgi:hypothetical protein
MHYRGTAGSGDHVTLLKIKQSVLSVLQSSGSDFTKSWQGSAFGRFGLVMVGLAFLTAVIVMLQGALTKKFHRELRLKVWPQDPTVSDDP